MNRSVHAPEISCQGLARCVTMAGRPVISNVMPLIEPAAMHNAALFCLCLVLSASASQGEDAWGTLSGRFVLLLQGETPATRYLRLPDTHGEHSDRIPDGSLAVNNQNKGVANVFLWLEDANETIRVHPSYSVTAENKAYLDTKRGRFIPHALTLRTSQTLVVRNEDKDAGYCIKAYVHKNDPFSKTIAAAQSFSHRFQIEEHKPHRLGCLIHPWMQSFLLVRKNPYMVVSDDNGHFSIAHLPTGHHTFRLWHETLGFVPGARFGVCCTDEKGQLTLEIKAGANPYGDIMLPLTPARQ